MMAGNPSWWSMHPPSQLQPSALLSSSQSVFPSHQYALGSTSALPFNSFPDHNQDQLPQSWSQLLLGGFSGEEDRYGVSHFQGTKKLENWENQILNLSSSAAPAPSRVPVVIGDVKQEVSRNSNLYGTLGDEEEFQAVPPPQPPRLPTTNWSSLQVMPVSSPKSCVTSLSSNTTNILDFSYNKAVDQSSECNSTGTGGGACKKARVQPSSSQPPLKVRKEKLGDRITALHQLVSPFGKTDTASVLLEAIGYIRFLQGQIEALSSPYLGSASANIRNQQSVQGERNCAFPEDPGQLLSDICLKRKGAPSNQDNQDKAKDLRSRGLCLVPVSCTQHVGSDSGADYWAPAIGGGF